MSEVRNLSIGDLERFTVDDDGLLFDGRRVILGAPRKKLNGKAKAYRSKYKEIYIAIGETEQEAKTNSPALLIQADYEGGLEELQLITDALNEWAGK